jgi:hypothetical protein
MKFVNQFNPDTIHNEFHELRSLSIFVITVQANSHGKLYCIDTIDTRTEAGAIPLSSSLSPWVLRPTDHLARDVLDNVL